MSNEIERVNGTMVRNLKEMKEHGRVMEGMNTNKEVEEKGMQPDPKQDGGPKLKSQVDSTVKK